MTREQAMEIILSPRGSPLAGSPEHAELVEFLRTSSECRRLYEEQQALWRAMNDWRGVEPSAGFDRRLLAQIEAEQGRMNWFERFAAGFRLPLAATLAALVLAAATVVRQQSPAIPAAPAVTAFEPAESRYVEQINRALDDLEMLADFAPPLPPGETPGES